MVIAFCRVFEGRTSTVSKVRRFAASERCATCLAPGATAIAARAVGVRILQRCSC